MIQCTPETSGGPCIQTQNVLLFASNFGLQTTILHESTKSWKCLFYRNGHGSATDGGLRGDGEEKWKPAEIGPVNKDDLVSAYLERHKDSDYGFQVQFS